MKKLLKILSLPVLSFTICFFALNYIPAFFSKFHFFESISFVGEALKDNATFISGAISFATTSFSNLLSTYGEWQQAQKRSPCIILIPKSVSCIRRNKKRDIFPEIVVGTGAYFIYVKMLLQNTGEETVHQCLINNQKIGKSLLKSNEICEIQFRICRNEKECFQKNYRLHITYRDNTETEFIQVARLTIDEKNRVAHLTKTYKRKRRFRK